MVIFYCFSRIFHDSIFFLLGFDFKVLSCGFSLTLLLMRQLLGGGRGWVGGCWFGGVIVVFEGMSLELDGCGLVWWFH